MLVVFLCCMMKIVEMTSGRRGRAEKRHQYYNERRRGLSGVRGAKEMTEVSCTGGGGEKLTPDSDCNSNPTITTPQQPSVNGINSTITTNLNGGDAHEHFISSTTSQDVEFVQDNSDYQWFIDYGYRDGSNVQHTSILSSISTSYNGIDDLGFYDAMSKNLDANLAEADMESFRTEDIHSLLTTLPTMCTDLQIQEKSREGEMYASMSGSLMEKIDLDSSLSQQTSSQGDSHGLIDTMSICKSELLFSPVKELPIMPGHNYSVDSLDCELPTEEDIMLTCQANKNNYTIAFEGSVTMYSEASDEHEIDKHESTNSLQKHHSPTDKFQLDTSMTKSDLGLTTWSKLKKRSCEMKLRRHPSGNNNTTSSSSDRADDDVNRISNTTSSDDGGCIISTSKSQSMPNLYKQNLQCQRNYPIQIENKNMNSSSIDSYSHLQRFPSGCIKVFDIQHQTNSGSLFSDIASSVDGFDSSCSDRIIVPPQPISRQSTTTTTTNKHPIAPNLNLVKRFIKQKNMCSADNVTDMDRSSASECFQSSGGSLEDNHRHKMSESINDNDHYKNQLNNWLRGGEISDTKIEEDNNKKIKRYLFNVNNNNSIDRSDSSDLKKKDQQDVSSVDDSASISMCSSSEATETTRFQRYSPRNRLKPQHLQTPLELVDRSMQTSLKKTANFIKFIEPSFLSKLKSDSKPVKPVYVLYPNYTLPSLDFLNNKNTEDLTKIFLLPQKFVPSTDKVKSKRPFSCNDIESLKKKGFDHVKDWESLTFLLPTEYRQILAQVPEVIEQTGIKPDELIRQKEKPLFCVTPPMRHKNLRPHSCDLTGTNVSSSSSTATQPSSGYRGSSTMLLTDSVQQTPGGNFNPLFIYRYDSVTSSEASFLMNEKKNPPLPKRSTSLPNGEPTPPPRPALPKSILRKSLAENYAKLKMRQNSSDDLYSDEGVDAGNDSSVENALPARPPTPPIPKLLDTSLISNTSQDELQQLEDFLKQSGFSCSENDEWDDNEVLKLRSCVNKFLSLKINQNRNKKSVSFSNQLNVRENELSSCNNNTATTTRYCPVKGVIDLPICEEAETSSDERSPKTSPKRNLSSISNDIVENKTVLITAAKDAVDQIIDHFAVANNREELENFGNSEQSPACAKLLLSTLCPALYAILSDGLKPNIETAFGTIGNSVWQVIEASSHDGPLTKSLNELVMKINTEDVITEGLIKFNSFIFGLLNVQSLDVWLSYLRMRESVLRKHYNNDSLLLMAHTGGSSIRSLIDLLIASLQPLNMLPFHIDLMFEYRQLHISLKRMSTAIQQQNNSANSGITSPVHFKISPTKPALTSKQWALFKIVRSIQNSLTLELGDEDNQLECCISEPIMNTLPQQQLRNDSNSLNYKPRPRSFIDHQITSTTTDVNSAVKKRWSDVHIGSKLHQAFDRLVQEHSDEEYTDSLEPVINNKDIVQKNIDSKNSINAVQGAKFKRLQMKWEMLTNDTNCSTSPPDSTSSRTTNVASITTTAESPTRQQSKSIKTPESPSNSGGNNSTNKSKIPRLIPSPVRSNSTLCNTSLQKNSGIPIVKKVSGIPVSNISSSSSSSSPAVKRQNTDLNFIRNRKTDHHNTPTRSSRVDQHETIGARHATRPTSLPYGGSVFNQTTQKTASKLIPPRRAASSSLNRINRTTLHHNTTHHPVGGGTVKKTTPKTVRTLTHRLPSDNGHLSFNQNEKLTVMLEVDDKWLLCCRNIPKTGVKGNIQKGLVPRSAVLVLESDLNKKF